MRFSPTTQIADIGLSAPAVRALHGAGYQTLNDLSEVSGSELMSLHGFGPKAQVRLNEALTEAGLRGGADTKNQDFS
jgi:DNA-directed RNA polymerase alpha subunit